MNNLMEGADLPCTSELVSSRAGSSNLLEMGKSMRERGRGRAIPNRRAGGRGFIERCHLFLRWIYLFFLAWKAVCCIPH